MARAITPALADTGILLVTSRRADRKALFDILDGYGFLRLHAARDTAQARALLSERPGVGLVLLEFCGEAREAHTFCARLHGMDAYRQVPVLGLLRRDAGRRAPDRVQTAPVAGWVHTPVQCDEVVASVREVLERPSEVPGPDGTPAPAGGDDYRFAFDADDREWIISRLDGTVLEVNAAFARHAGVVAADQPGRTLGALLGAPLADVAALRERLEHDDNVERVVKLPRSDGASGIRAVTRTTTHAGQRVHVTSLQRHEHNNHARRMLNMLARMHTTASDGAGLRAAAHLLRTTLALDFLGVYAALPETPGGPVVRAQELCGHPDMAETAPEVVKQPVLKRVLDGQTLMESTDARHLAGSEGLVDAMGFAAFAGLPLMDERGNVLGALLAGSRRPWESHELVPETLSAATVRFACNLELERARQQGRAHALQDGLTRLPNRLLFNDRLETTLREAHRTGEMFAVLFVDLDRFKSINDSLGHSIGDEVLMAVAQRLRGSVRSSDTVARYAGDEYIIIVRHITQRDDVLRIADKIVQLMDAPLMLADGSELHITASIGVSFYPDDAANGESLLKHADMAMYNAKGNGRNGYQVYAAAPEKAHQQRVALESKLRQAEKNGELRVHYQPQVDALTEDIVGMEALVRWEHPELGMISPGFFIPLAEGTGLIVSIGEWVLRSACDAAARWRKRYGLPLRVGVNLSALQLMQPNLPEVVNAALRESGLPADGLELEITESISVKSVPNLLDNLHALRDIGCRLAVDDFGTGQSSLDYLKKLPADRIKIDQSFVRNIGVDPDDEAIVKSTIEMVHGLNRAAVAEGVETEAHLDFLRAQHCDELQGYLFCRPLTRNAFDTMLAERQRLLEPGGSDVRARDPAT